MQISAQDAFSKPVDRAKWITSLANAEAGLDSLHFVMPFLVETSQWTQILSRSKKTNGFISTESRKDY